MCGDPLIAPIRRFLLLLFVLSAGCGIGTDQGQQAFYDFVKLDGPTLSLGVRLPEPPEQGSYAVVWVQDGVPVRAVMYEQDSAPVAITMRYTAGNRVRQTVVETVSASSPAKVIRHGRAAMVESESKTEKLITEFNERGRTIRTRYYVNGALISDQRERTESFENQNSSR